MSDSEILSISKVDMLGRDLFLSLFDIPDQAERNRIKELLVLRSDELGIGKNWNRILHGYEDEDARLEGEYQRGQNNFTNFSFEPDVQWSCGAWIADDHGVRLAKKDGSYQVASTIPIVPVALMRNISTGKEKVKLSYYKHGKQSLIVERKTVANASKIVELSSDGIEVTSDNAKLLVRYISDCVTRNLDEMPYLKAFTQLGWNESGFTPFSSDAVFDGEEENRHLYKAIASKGDFDTWKQNAVEWRKNPLVRLTMDASFASVLIEKVNALPFVLHLWGETGTGKTVALKAAMSIWGNPALGKMVRTMNMTQNSMMSTAAFLNSIPFAGDELQTIKSRFDSYDQLIMRVTEGIDRGRMSYDKVQETKSWRCSFLFTGEDPCTQASSGGGVKNRVIELEVTDRLFDDGNKASAVADNNYGFAGEKFVEHIMQREGLQDEFKNIFREILEKADTTDKQASSMALIMLADKISCELFFHDQPLTAHDVSEYLFSEKDVDAAERAYSFIVDHIAANDNRFINDNTGEIWGKHSTTKDGEAVLFIKTILERELQKQGFDFNSVKTKWCEKGYIEQFGKNLSIHTMCYGIKARFVKIILPNSTVDLTENEDDDELVPTF